MKILTSFLLHFFLLIGIASNSQATHLLGGEISYYSMAPGYYFAEYKAYYDCRVNTLPPSVQFNLASPGCGSTKTVTSTHKRTGSILKPYCTATGNGCNPNGLLNVMVVTYGTFISVPGNCPEWILSVRECSKSPVGNLISTTTDCMYLEAYISTSFANNHNESPEFNPLTNLFFTVNSPVTILNMAVSRSMVKTDSIGYSLVPALENAGTPYAYTSGTSYSNPIPSVNGVNLNPVTGMLTLTPNAFVSGSGPGANIYSVVVEAAGYKKINGVMTKVNSTQRNIPVFVVNNAPNQNPGIINATINGQPVLPNSVFQVQAGAMVNFQFGTSDANAGDSVTIVMPDPQYPYLPWNTTFASSGGTRPTGTFTYNTTGTTVDDLFYFPVIVKDNACPVRGITTQIYGIKVLANPLGINKDYVSGFEFSAFPNPFSDQVQFKISSKAKARTILIYNLLGQQIDQHNLSASAGNDQLITWEKAGDFAKGTYLARLVSEGQTLQTLRFIKQ